MYRALEDPKLIDTKNWKGQGIMGEVLSRMRNSSCINKNIKQNIKEGYFLGSIHSQYP